MKKLAMMLVVAGFVLALGQGCATAIKEGVGVATGAKGIYAPIQETADAASLGGYTRFELGQISDKIGGKAPAQLLQLLPGELDKELAVKRIPNRGGGKTLVIRGAIVYYESEGLLGTIIGPIEEVVVRTEFVDKASGKVLGVATCVGRTTTRVNRGVGKKAEGLAKAFVAWIDDRYPEEGRIPKD